MEVIIAHPAEAFCAKFPTRRRSQKPFHGDIIEKPAVVSGTKTANMARDYEKKAERPKAAVKSIKKPMDVVAGDIKKPLSGTTTAYRIGKYEKKAAEHPTAADDDFERIKKVVHNEPALKKPLSGTKTAYRIGKYEKKAAEHPTAADDDFERIKKLVHNEASDDKETGNSMHGVKDYKPKDICQRGEDMIECESSDSDDTVGGLPEPPMDEETLHWIEEMFSENVSGAEPARQSQPDVHATTSRPKSRGKDMKLLYSVLRPKPDLHATSSRPTGSSVNDKVQALPKPAGQPLSLLQSQPIKGKGKELRLLKSALKPKLNHPATTSRPAESKNQRRGSKNDDEEEGQKQSKCPNLPDGSFESKAKGTQKILHAAYSNKAMLKSKVELPSTTSRPTTCRDQRCDGVHDQQKPVNASFESKFEDTKKMLHAAYSKVTAEKYKRKIQMVDFRDLPNPDHLWPKQKRLRSLVV